MASFSIYKFDESLPGLSNLTPNLRSKTATNFKIYAESNLTPKTSNLKNHHSNLPDRFTLF
ncbi:hypothetical protein [Campylobacter showae]|uniref:Uncharacterized protein n=1 Tax=Campylobacter showae CSUNSWCD TaxID=1244083 RepID=M5IGV5_9BACT|nr:hypothetical protein [Campylobacter showae]EKU11712.1 hypothetical protein CSUNSWCD_1750 [Campylobacter showae CSUNSWCD]